MAGITRIVFDRHGRPSWHTVDTGKFMHRLTDYECQAALDFSEKEKAWFRKPLNERMEITD